MLYEISGMLINLLQTKTVVATITQEFNDSLAKEDRILDFFNRKITFKNGKIVSDLKCDLVQA
jgi:hypothetical protein